MFWEVVKMITLCLPRNRELIPRMASELAWAHPCCTVPECPCRLRVKEKLYGPSFRALPDHHSLTANSLSIPWQELDTPIIGLPQDFGTCYLPSLEGHLFHLAQKGLLLSLTSTLSLVRSTGPTLDISSTPHLLFNQPHIFNFNTFLFQ